MAQTQQASATLAGQGGVSPNPDVLTYPQRLLAYARTLINQGDYGMAVVVCHTACEIATERRLSEAIVARGVEDLRGFLHRPNSGYSLSDKRLRKLYTALTRDNIEREPFWGEFIESSDRRHRIVHRGVGVTPGDAEASHKDAEASRKAASLFVAHLMF
jgi:hypothetical protein